MNRRTLLKMAVAGTAAWVTPTIFTTTAEGQTPPHACCACYEGDPIVHGQPQPGPFIAAAVGYQSDAKCTAFCAGAAPPGIKGVVLHFTNPTTAFSAAGATSKQPGCHMGTTWLNRVLVYNTPWDGPGWHSHCPPKSELGPLDVKCDRAYWKTT